MLSPFQANSLPPPDASNIKLPISLQTPHSLFLLFSKKIAFFHPKISFLLAHSVTLCYE